MASPEFKVSPEQLQALEQEREQLARELEASQKKQEALAAALQLKEEQVKQPAPPQVLYVPTPTNTARVNAPKAGKRGFLLAVGGAFALSLIGGMYAMEGGCPNAPKNQVGSFFVDFSAPQAKPQVQAPVSNVPAPMVRTGRVVNVEGGLPLAPGASCKMVVKPNDLGNFNCRVNVTCDNVYGGQSIVYGYDATGYGNCTWSGATPLRFADRQAAWQDGDGLLTYDLNKGLISIGDTNLNLDGYLIEIAITK